MEQDDQNNQPPPPAIAGALTFPSRSDQDMQPTPVQPRQPRNLQGLLRFAMEATKAEDAPGESQLGPMDEERRRFLAEALKSLTVDVAEVLQRSIKVLSDPEKMHSIQLGQPLPEEVERAFADVMDYVDDIDVANDFYKLGGFAVFPVCAGADNAEVRARAAALLAELCQNNPYCQARALECGLVNVLLKLVESERGNALAKTLYALSCACREFPPACAELVSQEGCAALAGVAAGAGAAGREGEGDEAVLTKAAFLLRYLANNVTEAREQFIKLNIVKTIAEIIRKGRNSSTEHLLSTLLCLLGDDHDPAVLAQLKDLNLNLKNVLEEHLKNPEVQTSFLEEKEYAEELLKIVSNDVGVVNDEIIDR